MYCDITDINVLEKHVVEVTLKMDAAHSIETIMSALLHVASSGLRNIKLQTGFLFVSNCWFINEYELLLKITLLMSIYHTQ